MLFTSLFCLIAAMMLGIPMWAFFAGAVCFILNPLVVLFGFFMCLAMDAPLVFWVIGFLCILLDL